MPGKNVLMILHVLRTKLNFTDMYSYMYMYDYILDMYMLECYPSDSSFYLNDYNAYS